MVSHLHGDVPLPAAVLSDICISFIGDFIESLADIVWYKVAPPCATKDNRTLQATWHALLKKKNTWLDGNFKS